MGNGFNHMERKGLPVERSIDVGRRADVPAREGTARELDEMNIARGFLEVPRHGQGETAMLGGIGTVTAHDVGESGIGFVADHQAGLLKMGPDTRATPRKV